MVTPSLQRHWCCQSVDPALVSFYISPCSQRLINTNFSIAVTGLVVLGGNTKIEDPKANFRNSFAGTSSNGNGLATALVKVNFAYAGFEVGSSTVPLQQPVLTTNRTRSMS